MCLTYASLQGLQHIRSPCPIYAEHPRPSLMRGYITTPVGSTQVSTKCSKASATSTTSQHSLPWRTHWRSLLCTWMSIYRDVMLQYTTIWEPSRQCTLPWACQTPCRIAPTYNNCSRQFTNSNLSPSQTWAIKASQWSFCTEPDLYTSSTSPRTVYYGQP